jgi:Protein of unknown function (DUF3800)
VAPQGRLNSPGLWSWVAYVDESFYASAYWICVVLVHVDQVRPAQERLGQIVASWAADHGFPANAELHGSDLWHGSGPFHEVVPGIRRGIYDDALDALVMTQPRIVIRGVERHGLTLHPHRLAWRYAIESVDEEMERQGGVALVVADEHAETEIALRGDIATYAHATTGGWRPRTITRVLRALKFLDSKENRLLQGCDLVAFLHQRRQQIGQERHPRAQSAREAHWAKIAPSVAVTRLWVPPL